MAGIRFTRDVEVLLSVLGELLEEESEEGIDVLASSDSVADGVIAVGVAHVDGLVEEDHGCVGIP